MIEAIIQYLQDIIVQYGALGVFLATIVEELIAPIPSPIIALAAGFALIPGHAGFLDALLNASVLVAFPVAVGMSIGAAIVYYICFVGGKSVIEKYSKWLGVTWQDIEKAEQKFGRKGWDEVVLFSLRILPVVPGFAISAVCGIIRYDFARFIGVTAVGAFVRALLLGLIGWKVGELYETYADLFDVAEKFGLYIIIVITLVLAFAYFAKRMKNKSK